MVSAQTVERLERAREDRESEAYVRGCGVGWRGGDGARRDGRATGGGERGGASRGGGAAEGGRRRGGRRGPPADPERAPLRRRGCGEPAHGTNLNGASTNPSRCLLLLLPTETKQTKKKIKLADILHATRGSSGNAASANTNRRSRGKRSHREGGGVVRGRREARGDAGDAEEEWARRVVVLLAAYLARVPVTEEECVNLVEWPGWMQLNIIFSSFAIPTLRLSP